MTNAELIARCEQLKIPFKDIYQVAALSPTEQTAYWAALRETYRAWMLSTLNSTFGPATSAEAIDVWHVINVRPTDAAGVQNTRQAGYSYPRRDPFTGLFRTAQVNDPLAGADPIMGMQTNLASVRTWIAGVQL